MNSYFYVNDLDRDRDRRQELGNRLGKGSTLSLSLVSIALFPIKLIAKEEQKAEKFTPKAIPMIRMNPTAKATAYTLTETTGRYCRRDIYAPIVTLCS